MKICNPDEAIDIATRLEVKAVCQSNERVKSKLLAKARAVVESALIDNQNHSNLHHVLGLCWYAENVWSSEAKEQIERCFSTAIQLAASNEYATLYLGHFYFDEARYDKALKLFLQIDDSYFETRNQKYRVLKNHELILCCRLYLDATKVTITEINQFCEEYEQTESCEIPLPQEIVTCLSKLIVNETKLLKQMAERVILMLKRTDFERAKSITDAIRVLNAHIAK